MLWEHEPHHSFLEFSQTFMSVLGLSKSIRYSGDFVIVGFITAGFVSTYFTVILRCFQMMFIITGSLLQWGLLQRVPLYWLVSQYRVNNYCVLYRVKAKKGNRNQQRTLSGFFNHSPLLTMWCYCIAQKNLCIKQVPSLIYNFLFLAVTNLTSLLNKVQLRNLQVCLEDHL